MRHEEEDQPGTPTPLPCPPAFPRQNYLAHFVRAAPLIYFSNPLVRRKRPFPPTDPQYAAFLMFVHHPRNMRPCPPAFPKQICSCVLLLSSHASLLIWPFPPLFPDNMFGSCTSTSQPRRCPLYAAAFFYPASQTIKDTCYTH